LDGKKDVMTTMNAFVKRCLLGGLLGLVLACMGCGGNDDPVKSPGVGEDAPNMDGVPDPDKKP
jgi:hypothetical protein